jgi:MOSC domain-containing protein YiiM/GNAT superfamily N-acetyltransferase
MSELGRVLQVNVSGGGVPKLPVAEAWVSRFGVKGDGHNDRTLHGGPHRAVCLFAMEAIERIQSEGHPIEPGSVGENLTTLGIEWSTLPVGTRARIGPELVIELADATTPCATTRRSFTGGRFSRMSIDLHPADSRMYARVVSEGWVRPGDPIELLPDEPPAQAEHELKLALLDRALTQASLVAWQAANEAGLDVRVVEDGELAMVASPALPGPAFNHALGFARLPNLVGDATAFFDAHRCPGWIDMAEPPWPGAQAQLELDIVAASPADVALAPVPSGMTIRPIAPAEADAAARVMLSAEATGTDAPQVAGPAWRAALAGLAAHPHGVVLIAEQEQRPVAMAALFGYHSTGWLRAAIVLPEARNRGLHAALLSHRSDIARERGWKLIGAGVEPGSVSARNLARLGFERIGGRRMYTYQPRAGSAP